MSETNSGERPDGLEPEQCEMWVAAAAAKAAGFSRVEVDPADVIVLFERIVALGRDVAHQKAEREASEAEVVALHKLLRSVRDCLARHSVNPEADTRGMAERLSALVEEALR